MSFLPGICFCWVLFGVRKLERLNFSDPSALISDDCDPRFRYPQVRRRSSWNKGLPGSFAWRNRVMIGFGHSACAHGAKCHGPVQRNVLWFVGVELLLGQSRRFVGVNMAVQDSNGALRSSPASP